MTTSSAEKEVTLELVVTVYATVDHGCRAWKTMGGGWNPPDPPTIDSLEVFLGKTNITKELDDIDLEAIEQQILEGD